MARSPPGPLFSVRDPAGRCGAAGFPAGRRAAFAKVLDEAGVSYTLRREKGSGIEAACGQLALKRKLEDAGAAGGCANKNVG